MQQTRSGLAAVGVIGVGDVDAVGRVDLEFAQLHSVELRVVTRQDQQLDISCADRFELERLSLCVWFEGRAHDFSEAGRLGALSRCIDCEILAEQVHRAVLLLVAAGRVVQDHAVDGVRSGRGQFEDEFVAGQPLRRWDRQDRHVFDIRRLAVRPARRSTRQGGHGQGGVEAGRAGRRDLAMVETHAGVLRWDPGPSAVPTARRDQPHLHAEPGRLADGVADGLQRLRPHEGGTGRYDAPRILRADVEDVHAADALGLHFLQLGGHSLGVRQAVDPRPIDRRPSRQRRLPKSCRQTILSARAERTRL